MSEQSNKKLETGCIACGWTLDKQKRCDYTSHLKLFYGASKRGAWFIGSDVILKDRPDEGPKARIEVKTLNHLATYTDIPVPNVIRDWVDRDGRYFVLNETYPWPNARGGLAFFVRTPKNRHRRSSRPSA
jgi:hypothetical protein